MQRLAHLPILNRRHLHRMPAALLMACGLGLSLPAQGEWPSPGVSDALTEVAWAVVPDQELAEQRGGLIRRGGFELALGIERTTAINGEVVARTVLMDRSGIGTPLANGGLHIRNGLDGLAVGALAGPNWTTVIQNQVSNQIISNRTTLNLDLAGMNLNRMELRRVLDAQMIQDLRGY